MTEPISDAQLEEWERLASDAGEDFDWEYTAGDKYSYVQTTDGDILAHVYPNAAHLAGHKERALFIAASRTAVPALIAEVRRLRTLVQYHHDVRLTYVPQQAGSLCEACLKYEIEGNKVSAPSIYKMILEERNAALARVKELEARNAKLEAAASVLGNFVDEAEVEELKRPIFQAAQRVLAALDADGDPPGTMRATASEYIGEGAMVAVDPPDPDGQPRVKRYPDDADGDGK